MFPTKTMSAILIYAGMFCFLAVCIYFYDELMKRKKAKAKKKKR